MREAWPYERGAVGRRGLHVPANDGGSPLIRTSEYIANFPRVIEHPWLFGDKAADRHIHNGNVRRQMGLVGPLGDWMGTWRQAPR
jgi:hypothetical protein